jgi:hypothetical protein
MAVKLAFAEDMAHRHDKNLIALGQFLSDYFPGSHVECESLIDTAIRLLRGHRRELRKRGIGWGAQMTTEQSEGVKL